jgi:hypothetical protein
LLNQSKIEASGGLIRQSGVAAIVAAYTGCLLFFAFDMIWRIQSGADARMCPPGSDSPSDWCTIAEFSLAFLLVPVWALYGLPFALVLTLPTALVLARFAPALETRLYPRELALTQYALGSFAGSAILALLAAWAGERPSGILLEITCGIVAGIIGVFTFRRRRYQRAMLQK